MSDDYRESPVVGRDGWTRITDGGNIQFRHENTGLVISNRQYAKLRAIYPGNQFIPEESVRAVAGDQVPAPQAVSVPLPPKDDFVEPKILSQTKPTPGGSKTGFVHPNNYVAPSPSPKKEKEEEPPSIADISTMDVKSRQRSRSVKHPKPTSTALGLGFKKLLLLITTGIVVRFVNDGRAAMTEQEADILGRALGNLLEPTWFNEQYGWLVAETGDWQAIGYVLIMYVGRINDIVQEKKANIRPSYPGGTVNTTPVQSSPAQSNGHQPQHAGANMPFSSSTKSGIPWMGGQQ